MTTFLMGVFAIVLFLGVLAVFGQKSDETPAAAPPPPKPMPYGDAHFATFEEVLAHGLVCPMAAPPPTEQALQSLPLAMPAPRALPPPRYRQRPPYDGA